jgi:hypothetical protein
MFLGLLHGMAGLGGLSVCLAVLACSGPVRNHASLPLSLDRIRVSTGLTLDDLLSPTDSTIVSIYSPSDCLSCTSALLRWREWQQKSRGRRSLILLTRSPSRHELKAFALERITEYLVLAAPPPVPPPTSFLVVAGRVSDFGRGPVGENAMAKRVLNQR